MPSNYKIITTRREIKQLAKHCLETGYASIDFETNGLPVQNPDGKPTVIGICFQPGFSYVIPLAHYESPFNEDDEWIKILQLVGELILKDTSIIKVAWNLKFELKWLLKYGIELRGILLDGMLAKHLLDENTLNDLKTCVRTTIPEYSNYEDEVHVLKAKYKGWDKIPLDPLSKYNGLDCDLTLRLMWHYERALIKANLYNLFRNSSMMSTRVLGESELMGMPVDVEYLNHLVEKYKNLLAEKEREMRSLKPIRKFNRKTKEAKVEALIDKIESEIVDIEKSGAKNAKVLIDNRNKKIRNILAGTIPNKQMPQDINFDSPTQMVELLYTSKYGLKLPKQWKKNKVTKKESLSTDEKSLETIKHLDSTGFIKMLLEHRSLAKLNSTYVEGMLKSIGEDGKVHCNYKIHGTVTGRFSSAEPNMQNIPRVTTNPDIKKMFIAPPGYLLMEVDYAQAELRVVSELANEVEMIDWFNKGISVHVAVACKAEGADYGEVYPITKDKKHPKYTYWTKRKKRAKTINFGILYGQTEMKLAETLNSELEPGEKPVTVAQAKAFMDNWFSLFPSIAKWIKKQHKKVRAEGYVTNMFGRKRRLYDWIDSPFKWKVEEAERLSVNTPVQGTSADFTNLAAIVIREKVQQGYLPYDFRQVYTVHDSIGYFIRPEHIHEVAPKIIQLCSDPETMPYFGFKLKKVKMKVEPEIGTRWSNIEEYNPNVDYTKLLNSNE